jgi:selT/selW/selH-like putative selenoprotein
MQSVNYIRSQVPGLQASGGNYPVGPIRQSLGSFFSFCFMASIALAFGLGRVVLPADLATIVDQNKSMVVVAGFMCNMIGGAFLQSGAFEVYLDGRLIFSKLESGGIPDPVQLLQLVKMALQSA